MKHPHLWPLILAVTAAMCLAFAALAPLGSSPGTLADLYQNGQFLQTLRLDEPVEYTLFASSGASNTITVRDGRICISHATCPDQVCVKQGWVNTAATPIVCLPNGLVIQIRGGDRDIDAAAG